MDEAVTQVNALPGNVNLASLLEHGMHIAVTSEAAFSLHLSVVPSIHKCAIQGLVPA